MAVKAAHGSLIQTTGASTAFTDEASTVVTGYQYQLNTAAKRIIDPGTALTVKDNAVAVAATAADFLFGKATLTLDPGAGPVTMSGSYLPLLDIALVRTFSLKVAGTVLDISAVNGGAAKQRLVGLQTADLTLETTAQRYDDLDSGGGVVTIDGAAVALYAGPMLVSILPYSGGDYFRGWFQLVDLESKGDTDGLISLTMTLTGHVRTGTVGTGSTAVTVGFGWGT